jgi:DNA-binding CsgD family transcriptional regulator
LTLDGNPIENPNSVAALGHPIADAPPATVEGVVLNHKQLEIVEALFDLDPIRTYPRRCAERISELVGAHGFRLELGQDVHLSDPAPSGVASITVALKSGSDDIGVLHLYGAGLSEDDVHRARWAGRLFGRGVKHARRIEESGASQRTYEDVQAMLERTPLTPRERDVVGRLLSGSSTRQIAESTGLTVATVNTYLKRIFAKLGVHSRVELVARVTGTRGVIPTQKVETSSP